MKLIELLIQETLSGKFKWPECCYALVQGSSGAVYLAGGGMPLQKFELAEDWELAEVTREQYEAALAAAQQPVWNGEGLPPIDLLCEWRNDSGAEPKWEEGYLRAKINTESGELLVIEPRGGYALEWRGMHAKFRPIRSEADKKRDAAISAIDATCLLVRDASTTAAAIYDAIAAGEIPGVHVD